MPTRPAFGRARLRRKLVAALGVGTLVSVALVAGTGIASAAGVTGDDTRATAVDSNINACPSGDTLVDGGTTSTTQNGITVTVTHTNAPQADGNFTGTPNGALAGTLPAGTDMLTVTLPAGNTLTGHIYVKGGDGYNDYPGSALTQLIPPVNNGGNIAGLSHYFICGTLAPPVQQTGTLDVTKKVVGNGPGPFTIKVDCGAAGTQTYTNVVDGTTETATYPAGTSCTVTETDAAGASSTTYAVGNGAASNTPATVAIAANTTTTVTVTNTFNAAPQPGDGTLVVDKSVVGNGAGPFTIQVACGGNTTTYTGVTQGFSKSVDYPDGTSCTVTETDAGGASSTTYTIDKGAASNNPANLTIHSGQTTTVVVTNTFNAPPPPPGDGALVVNKTVVGNGSGPFTIKVDCGQAGGATYTNVVNGTSESASYPAGAVCTVTEPNGGKATSTTYTVDGGTPGTSGPTVTIASGTTTTVTVTNTFVAPPDPLRIVKAVDKKTAAYGDDLTYTLTVYSGEGAGPQNVLVTDNVPAGTTFVSSHCDSPCTTGAPVNGVVSWHVGDMLPNSSFVVSFVVQITPQPAGATPAEETIPNSAVVASAGAGPVPSNTVTTDVLIVAVEGETFTQPPADPGAPATTVEAVTTSTATLPFTGLPADQLLALAALFVITGGVLIAATRRRGAPDGD